MQDDFFDLRANTRVVGTRRDRIADEACVHDGIRVRTLEWQPAGDHLVKDCADAVDVRALVAPLALHLLRCHVVRSSHRRREAAECQAAGGGGLGDAEVHDAQ